MVYFSLVIRTTYISPSKALNEVLLRSAPFAYQPEIFLLFKLSGVYNTKLHFERARFVSTFVRPFTIGKSNTSVTHPISWTTFLPLSSIFKTTRFVTASVVEDVKLETINTNWKSFYVLRCHIRPMVFSNLFLFLSVTLLPHEQSIKQSIIFLTKYSIYRECIYNKFITINLL